VVGDDLGGGQFAAAHQPGGVGGGQSVEIAHRFTGFGGSTP
jgi:hypothetical protein